MEVLGEQAKAALPAARTTPTVAAPAHTNDGLAAHSADKQAKAALTAAAPAHINDRLVSIQYIAAQSP